MDGTTARGGGGDDADARLRERLDPIEAHRLELAERSFRRRRSSGLLYLVRRKRRPARRRSVGVPNSSEVTQETV